MSGAGRTAPAPPRNPLLDLVPADAASVPALFGARAGRTPDAPFLRWGEERWTYGEAWDEALRFAAWVERQRSERGPIRVAGFLPSGPEALWAWLGTLAAGAVHVPLNRGHRGQILADMIARSGAAVLVTDAEGRADLPDLAGAPVEVVLTDWEEVRALRPIVPAAPAPGDLAELIFTSGTTGRSKAVELSHGQLCRGAGWVAWSLGLGAADVFHAWMPLFHIAGQVDTVLAAAVGGGSIALYPGFSRSRFWDQVAESGATLFIGFANVARLLCELPRRDDDAGSTLRAGVTGAMPADLSREFEARFGVRLHDVYGMTEIEPMILPWPEEETPPGSCGRPSPDLEVVVLGDDGAPAPPGAVGEIACRSRAPNVLSGGYEGEPAASAAARDGGWFRSGDLGRVDDDGFFYFVDRLKHSIRRRGENISSWELESIVCGHPGVAEACAIGVPAALGEEDVKLVVVPAAGAELDPVELRAWCEARMATFMAPRYIEVVAALPRAETGKVMKEQLRAAGAGVWDAGERR